MSAKRARGAGRSAERPAEPDTEEVGQGTGGELAAADSAQADEELADLGVQLPDGAMGTLYRLLDGGEKEFIEESAVAGWTVANVAARYGGGRYMLYLKKPHPEVAGRWFKAGSKPFRIAGPSRTGTAIDVAGAAPGVPVAEMGIARSYGELIQSTTRAALDNQQLMQQMQLALLKSLTDRPVDPSADLVKVLLLKLLDRDAAPAGPSIADVIALADKMANRTGPVGQLKETMELLKTARELGGERADVPGWIPIAERALGLLQSYVPPAPKQLPAGDAAGEPEPIVEVATVNPAAHPLLKWLAPMVPVLSEHARLDRDPDTYAGVICDQIAPQHTADVLAFLTSPDFLPQLQAAFPSVVPFAAWYGELGEQVVERLQERQGPQLVDDAPPAAP